jgi:hypothetical protein
MKPLIDLARLALARMKSRTVCPLAPADLVLEIAIDLANLEKRDALR